MKYFSIKGDPIGHSQKHAQIICFSFMKNCIQKKKSNCINTKTLKKLKVCKATTLFYAAKNFKYGL